MDIGISSYTFTWAIGVPGAEPENSMTVFDLINKAVELDVKVVQIADNLPLEMFSVQELKELKVYADQVGIRIEVGARLMTIERLQQYLKIVRLVESPILRFVIDGPGFEPGLDEIQAIIQAIIPELEEQQIILAIENHDRLSVREFVETVQRASSSQVGICLDTVNSIGAGEGIETVINRLMPITVNLHIKEFIIRRVSYKMGFVIEGAPLGRGMLSVPDLVSKAGNACRSAILEQWVPPEPAIRDTILKEKEWAKESIVYLKTVLNPPVKK